VGRFRKIDHPKSDRDQSLDHHRSCLCGHDLSSGRIGEEEALIPPDPPLVKGGRGDYKDMQRWN
jgi:hypothetical protein